MYTETQFLSKKRYSKQEEDIELKSNSIFKITSKKIKFPCNLSSLFVYHPFCFFSGRFFLSRTVIIDLNCESITDIFEFPFDLISPTVSEFFSPKFRFC
jgi:hypothetical protein